MDWVSAEEYLDAELTIVIQLQLECRH